jgi:hypothetical protein
MIYLPKVIWKMLISFKSTMISDGFARRNEYDQAIDILSKFYQSAPTRKNSDQVTKRIVKNIHDQIAFFSKKKSTQKSSGNC